MISKNVKRIIVIYFAILLSALIWNVNQNIFGNPFLPCLILSTTTFLLIYTPFEIYFSFRDFWFDRWKKPKVDSINIEKRRIKVEDKRKKKIKYLSALIASSNNDELIKSKETLIVICHGLSDTKETLQFFYFPLVMHGFIVLAYDARGTGGSKKLGRRNQFYKQIDDFKLVIKWVKTQDKFRNKKIYSIGFSLGALIVLCGGFPNTEIEKIVAISSISDYKKNLPKFNPILLMRYMFKGVKLFPNEEENKNLSPINVMKEVKKRVSEDNWKILSKRVLLIHCRNDKLIKLRNFEENSNFLELPEKNKILLTKGGHMNKKNELILLGASLHFLD